MWLKYGAFRANFVSMKNDIVIFLLGICCIAFPAHDNLFICFEILLFNILACALFIAIAYKFQILQKRYFALFFLILANLATLANIWGMPWPSNGYEGTIVRIEIFKAISVFNFWLVYAGFWLLAVPIVIYIFFLDLLGRISLKILSSKKSIQNSNI
ncbi:hypothetical protein [Campylobacter sp. JMF_03 NE3]|uniref:hypothetical protein n=2 Tax=Campylobacter TaxID=194 RepID=UPI0022EA026E|nr:hypothetical protein [Campylobacter sp. JMF_03 NE3]MDA3053158.1 hypothetical protein [Campylobacter sp. JMF_03 NE3]